MATYFEDRISGSPNRYKVTTEDGETFYAVFERADEPTTEGTPLNAETFNTMLSEIYLAIAGAGVLPEVTVDDAGKILRVNDEGVWAALAIVFAEDGEF